MKTFAFSFLILLLSSQAQAAACCGGSLGAPSIIAGDDQAQVSTSYSVNRVETKALGNGQWQNLSRPQTTESFKIEAAHLLSDLWQVGGTLPFVRKSQNGSSDSSGLGDVSASLSYEFLNDWNYSPLTPKGIGFLQLTLPTGKSIQESEDLNQLDARGRGFLAFGAGASFTKAWTRWDAQSLFEVHRSQEKKSGELSLKPGWGGSALLAVGYNTTHYRYGLSLSENYEDAISVRGNVNSSGALERYMTAGLSLSALLSDEWTSTFTYSDQTLFGSPNNTSLGKIAQLSLQKRWAR